MTRNTTMLALAAAALAVAFAGAIAAPKSTTPAPLEPVHVCVDTGDGIDNWTFMARERTTPIPSQALAASIKNAIRHTGEVRGSTDLMLGAEAIRYSTDAKPTPVGDPDPQPGGYDCTCATATYRSGAFTGCSVGGCAGCYVCVYRAWM